ncbi:unnamed protein product [Heligmosomoides polygyrus]|uniref:DSPn domain-containing protein n=1 Tax=Heligmosomoides polygyrus TaxID=6339 RepID=A0A183GKF9_HELPZ|nr:unnamed protein product [Heligmosomoides polygyrus]
MLTADVGDTYSDQDAQKRARCRCVKRKEAALPRLQQHLMLNPECGHSSYDDGVTSSDSRRLLRAYGPVFWIYTLRNARNCRCVTQEEAALPLLLEESSHLVFQHGYDLPVTEPDCYYDVCFSGIEDTVFLYPSFCVLCAAVRAIRFDDQNTALPALDEFLRVFSSEKFIICGGTARLDPTDRAIGLCSTSHFRSLAHAKEPYAQTVLV